MYIVQTRLYSFKITFHFPSGPISLVTPASLNSVQEPLLHVLTSHIHVCTLHVHVHTLNMGTADCLHIPLRYMTACTALVIGMYYAIVQESAVW
jgi:hypothetical protein